MEILCFECFAFIYYSCLFVIFLHLTSVSSLWQVNDNVTVILLSEIVWEKFRPNTGCFEPLLFHFPDYSKGKRVQEAYQTTDSEYVITSSLYYITVAQAYQCVHVNINEDQICQWPQILYNNDYFA